MLQPRRFLFGLISIQAFTYYWEYTTAQIELLLSDRPLVLYKDKDNGSKGGSSSVKAPSAEEANKAYDEWLANKEKIKGKKININDYILDNG